MSKDNTYYAYLAEEVSVQRNGALDELSAARTELRLANITIASLETELFHVKDDFDKCANELDYLNESIESLGGYLEHLEKNAGEAVAISQQRLRERIDNLEAENARLEALVDWNMVDSAERLGGQVQDGRVVFGNRYEDVNIPPYYDDVREEEPENTPSSLIMTSFTDEEMQALIEGIALPPATNVIAVTGIGAPGQGVKINEAEVLGNTEAVDNIQEIILPSGTSRADLKIRELIEASYIPGLAKDTDPSEPV